jgi:hypothetical protein
MMARCRKGGAVGGRRWGGRATGHVGGTAVGRQGRRAAGPESGWAVGRLGQWAGASLPEFPSVPLEQGIEGFTALDRQFEGGW